MWEIVLYFLRFLEWLQSFTRYLHTPTPVHYDRERRVSEIYYELLTDCNHSKKTEEEYSEQSISA